jgi:hypothetical protein
MLTKNRHLQADFLDSVGSSITHYLPALPITGIALLSYIWMIVVPHRKRVYGPPRPITGIALLSYIWMIVVPHRKHDVYGPPQPITGIALLS